MTTSACLIIALLMHEMPIPTRFEQLTPRPLKRATITRSPKQTRAVVLLHGLVLHPFSDDRVSQPLMRDWQSSRSRLVRTLANHSDVFAFAYSQLVSVDDILGRGKLVQGINNLKKAGYKEITVIGHSAGGLIARQLAEDYPNIGITRVIQICAPNEGSDWAKYAIVRKTQEAFVRSLSREARLQCRKKRQGKTIPKDIDFVCVVANGAGVGDGLVKCQSQWTTDLQQQGIPICVLKTTHWRAMRSQDSIKEIVRHVLKDHPRWSAKQVRQQANLLFNNTESGGS